MLFTALRHWLGLASLRCWTLEVKTYCQVFYVLSSRYCNYNWSALISRNKGILTKFDHIVKFGRDTSVVIRRCFTIFYWHNDFKNDFNQACKQTRFLLAVSRFNSWPSSILVPSSILTFQSRRKCTMSAKICIHSTFVKSVLEENFWPKSVHCKLWQQKETVLKSGSHTRNENAKTRSYKEPHSTLV